MSKLEAIKRLRAISPDLDAATAKAFVDAGLDADLATILRRAEMDANLAQEHSYQAGYSDATLALRGGLSRRDEFAKAALTGITANPNFFSQLFQQNTEAAAEFARDAADAALAALDGDGDA